MAVLSLRNKLQKYTSSGGSVPDRFSHAHFGTNLPNSIPTLIPAIQ